ncbi:MAG: VWA domain-containing protein [Dysgonamonadaceae bacterium]|jgi:Ca-activated chloride channel family protein|nr:VWA domain-containing protein [Dysgonamonadaceae bacterium]
MKTFNYYLFATLLLLTACGGNDYESQVHYPGVDYEPDSYNEKYKDYVENPFVLVSEQPVSTFSIDADGASYSNMRRYLNWGQLPPKASVRIEEYINYFTFNYPEPANGENVSLHTELSTCPWNAEHYLLRIGIKGKTIPENELPPSNYVFLIDVSGSMNSPSKLGILKAGFKTMVDQLRDNDRVAIVTYAGYEKVLLESTPADKKDEIKKAIDQLSASGSTAGAKAIVTAYEIAQKNFIPNGNNRIILGTDGDFNVGITNTDDLVKLVEEKRDMGIYLTTLGVGEGNLNDYMMEQIADHGNGNYEYIDNADQILKIFVYEKSKFYSVANDCKNQLTFNPSAVHSYRLIGYENRSLQTQDFANDSIDAGEIGSSQTITAIYELILSDTYKETDIAAFDFRYKIPGQKESRLLSLPVQQNPIVEIRNASENMRFAAAVTAWGLLMKQSVYKGDANKQMVVDLAKDAKNFDPHNFRQEFVNLVSKSNF